MSEKPWTPERSDRAWRWVFALLALSAFCLLFAAFAQVMAILTD